MRRYRSDPWAGVVGGAVLLFVAGVVLGLMVIIPMVIAIATTAARLHDRVVDLALGVASDATGESIDVTSGAVRTAAAMIINAAVLMVLYFLFLVGTHLGTFLLLGLVGMVVGLILTALSGLRTDDDPADLLSTLDFWDGKGEGGARRPTNVSRSTAKPYG